MAHREVVPRRRVLLAVDDVFEQGDLEAAGVRALGLNEASGVGAAGVYLSRLGDLAVVEIACVFGSWDVV